LNFVFKNINMLFSFLRVVFNIPPENFSPTHFNNITFNIQSRFCFIQTGFLIINFSNIKT
jgi:hypothetical protein